jgi:hypothetical protein
LPVSRRTAKDSGHYRSATVYALPTIASSPLSQYQKGLGCARPAIRCRMTSANVPALLYCGLSYTGYHHRRSRTRGLLRDTQAFSSWST